MNAIEASTLRRDGRIAGAVYLIVVLTGMFCLAYVPSHLGTGIAGASAHASLFRAGIAAFLLMQVAFLLLPLALYRVLGDVDRGIATAMVGLAAVSVPIGLTAATHQLEALSLLEDAASGITDAMEAAFALSQKRYTNGLHIATLFWGLWLLPFGWLVIRSARLPRVLGMLLMLGGLGYVIQVFGDLVPALKGSTWIGYANMPAALGEIGSCLWLLAFGAKGGGTAVPPRLPTS